MINDLRYAIRTMRKDRGSTSVAVLTLALAISANAVMFSFVNSAVLSPLPYEDPEQLVWVWEKDLASGARNLLAPTTFIYLRDHSHVLDYLAASRFVTLHLMLSGEAEQPSAQACSSSFFPMLGVKAALGRTFLPEEELPGRNQVILLSYGFWQRRFGADPGIIGQTLIINSQGFTVIGVLPGDLDSQSNGDLCIPLSFDAEILRNGLHDLNVWARLKSGVRREEAEAGLQTVARQLEEQHPDTNRGLSLMLEPVQEVLVAHFRRALLLLFGAVGFVLLIACANLANLMLATASARQQEVAIRLALGASRMRLLRQSLVESGLVALLGGAAGLLLALYGIDFAFALIPREQFAGLHRVSIDGHVTGFTLAISLLAALFCGLAPFFQVSQIQLNHSLKQGGGRQTEGSGTGRSRRFLVVAETASALVLLIGAGLMIRSFVWLQNVGLGFNPDNVLSIYVALPEAKYRLDSQKRAFFQQVLEGLRAIPGAQSAGAINSFASNGWSPSGRFSIAGSSEPDAVHTAEYCVIDANYFRTMGIPLLRGQMLSEKEKDQILINRTMAFRYWPDTDPIGKRIKPEGMDSWLTVAGVVGDVRFWGVTGTPPAQVYRTYLETPESAMGLIVRTSSDPLGLVEAVRREVSAVDRDQPLARVSTLQQDFGLMFWQKRFSIWMFSLFSIMALLLAAVGIYGVISHAVTQRTREIGIRMALGAQQKDVLQLILGQGLKITLVGMMLGLVGSFALTRLMASQLYGVTANDPSTYIGISLLLTAVALLACYIPARRATKVDPMEALRCE